MEFKKYFLTGLFIFFISFDSLNIQALPMESGEEAQVVAEEASAFLNEGRENSPEAIHHTATISTVSSSQTSLERASNVSFNENFQEQLQENETFTPEENSLQQQVEQALQGVTLHTQERLDAPYAEVNRLWQEHEDQWEKYHNYSHQLKRAQHQLNQANTRRELAEKAMASEVLSKTTLGKIEKYLKMSATLLSKISSVPVQAVAGVAASVSKGAGIINYLWAKKELLVSQRKCSEWKAEVYTVTDSKTKTHQEIKKLKKLAVEQEQEQLLNQELATQKLAEILKPEKTWDETQWLCWAKEMSPSSQEDAHLAIAQLAITHPEWAKRVSKIAWRQRIDGLRQKYDQHQKNFEEILAPLAQKYRAARHDEAMAANASRKAFQALDQEPEKMQQLRNQIKVLAEQLDKLEGSDQMLFAAKFQEFEILFEQLIKTDAEWIKWEEAVSRAEDARAALWTYSKDYKLLKEKYFRHHQRLQQQLQADEKGWYELWPHDKQIPYHQWFLPEVQEKSEVLNDDDVDVSIEMPQTSLREKLLRGKNKIWLAKHPVVTDGVALSAPSEKQEKSVLSDEELRLQKQCEIIKEWNQQVTGQEKTEQQLRYQAREKADDAWKAWKNKKRELNQVRRSQQREEELSETASFFSTTVTRIDSQLYPPLTYAGKRMTSVTEAPASIKSEWELTTEEKTLWDQSVQAEEEWTELLKEQLPFFKKDHSDIPLPSFSAEEEGVDPILEAWKKVDRELVDYRKRITKEEQHRFDAMAQAASWERNHRRWSLRIAADRGIADVNENESALNRIKSTAEKSNNPPSYIPQISKLEESLKRAQEAKEQACSLWKQAAEESSFVRHAKEKLVQEHIVGRVSALELQERIELVLQEQKILDQAANMRWELFQKECQKKHQEGVHEQPPLSNDYLTINTLKSERTEFLKKEWEALTMAVQKGSAFKQLQEKAVENYWVFFQEVVSKAAAQKLNGLEVVLDSFRKESSTEKKEAKKRLLAHGSVENGRAHNWAESITIVDEKIVHFFKDEKKWLDQIGALWDLGHAAQEREQARALERALQAYQQGDSNAWLRLDSKMWQQHRDQVSQDDTDYQQEQKDRDERLQKLDQAIDLLQKKLVTIDADISKTKDYKKNTLEAEKKKTEEQIALHEKEWNQLFLEQEKEEAALYAASHTLLEVQEYVKKEEAQERVIQKARETWREQKKRASTNISLAGISVGYGQFARDAWGMSKNACCEIEKILNEIRKDRLALQSDSSSQSRSFSQSSQKGEQLLSLHQEQAPKDKASIKERKKLLFLYQHAADHFAAAAIAREQVSYQDSLAQIIGNEEKKKLPKYQQELALYQKNVGSAYGEAAKQEAAGHSDVANLYCEAASFFKEAVVSCQAALDNLVNGRSELAEYQQKLSLYQNNVGCAHGQAAEQEAAGHSNFAKLYGNATPFFEQAVVICQAALDSFINGESEIAEYQQELAQCQYNIGSTYEEIAKQKVDGRSDVAELYGNAIPFFEQSAINCQAALDNFINGKSELAEYQQELAQYQNSVGFAYEEVAKQERARPFDRKVKELYDEGILYFEQAAANHLVALERLIQGKSELAEYQKTLAQYQYDIASCYANAAEQEALGKTEEVENFCQKAESHQMDLDAFVQQANAQEVYGDDLPTHPNELSGSHDNTLQQDELRRIHDDALQQDTTIDSATVALFEMGKTVLNQWNKPENIANRWLRRSKTGLNQR